MGTSRPLLSCGYLAFYTRSCNWEKSYRSSRLRDGYKAHGFSITSTPG